MKNEKKIIHPLIIHGEIFTFHYVQCTLKMFSRKIFVWHLNKESLSPFRTPLTNHADSTVPYV